MFELDTRTARSVTTSVVLALANNCVKALKQKFTLLRALTCRQRKSFFLQGASSNNCIKTVFLLFAFRITGSLNLLRAFNVLNTLVGLSTVCKSTQATFYAPARV